MMRKNKEQVNKPVETIDTLIGTGTVLQGDLEFTGGIRVDGHIKGHITALDSNKGSLVLSETGMIDGDVHVPHLVINGKVNGNITSGAHVELQVKANITGDVHYKVLEMESGSIINGNLVPETTAPVYDVVDAVDVKADKG